MSNTKYVTINGVNFEALSGKKAQLLVEDYKYAERRGDTLLRHVYNSWSDAKDRAFYECDEIRRKVGGSQMYICSYCIMFFTLVYAIWLPNSDKCYIVKETPSHRYVAEVYKGALR